MIKEIEELPIADLDELHRELMKYTSMVILNKYTITTDNMVGC